MIPYTTPLRNVFHESFHHRNGGISTRNQRVRFFALCLLVTTLYCFGEKDLTLDPGNLNGATVIFQLDNDLFTGSDKDYTNGARFAYLYSLSNSDIKGFQKFLQNQGDNLADSIRRNEAESLSFRIPKEDPQKAEAEEMVSEYELGFGLTQLMFTPNDPDLAFVPDRERPYASWLGAEFSVHSKTDKVLRSMLFTIGTTGERTFAHETQDWVHIHLSNSPLFQGWDRQAPQEFTLNIHFDSKHSIEKKEFGPLDFDGYWEWGGALGNFRIDAYAGSTFRVGLNLPVQYMTPRLQIGSYSHDLFVRNQRKRPGCSVYGFASGRSTLVGHDITLDGPWFSDWEDSVSHTPIVLEGVLGLGFRWAWFTATYSRTFRTNEFEGQDGGHQFGSIQVAASFYL